MLKKNKNLKLYYSISEVAQMLGVNESLLRFWEDEFPQQLKPKRVSGGRSIRQYSYHLVKERGMTLQGARQRLRDNREGTLQNFDVVERLKAIRTELVSMRDALNAFTYEDMDALKKNIEEGKNADATATGGENRPPAPSV